MLQRPLTIGRRLLNRFAESIGNATRSHSSIPCFATLKALRFLTFLLYVGFFAGFTIHNARAQSAPPLKPNVVLIFGDDLGYGDLGSYGATDLATPNIDRLAEEGVRFTDFYTDAVCGPSRAMLLTGSYPPRVSLAANLTSSSPVGIHANEETLGEIMRAAGYATGLFGKWHLGDHHQYRPLRHGFDRFYGIPVPNDMWPFHPRTFEEPDEDPRECQIFCV